MTNINAPRGAQSFDNTLSSKFDLRVNKYVVADTDATPLFINDIVKTTGQSDFEGIPIVTKISSQNDFIRGIVVSFEEDPEANLPLYRKANTQRVVYVCDDPFIKFEMQVSGNFTQSDAGKKANISIGSGNTAIGISTDQLDSTTFTNNDAQLKILRLVERQDNELGTHAKVECTIFKHESFFFDGVVAGEDIFFCRQNGDDTQDGKSWEEAFQTGPKAMLEAKTIASASTPVMVHFADSGSYQIDGNSGIFDYVHVFAPSAALYGSYCGIQTRGSLTAYSFTSGFIDFVFPDTGIYPTLKLNYMYSLPSTEGAIRITNSNSANVNIGTLRVTGIGKYGVYINNAGSTKNIIKIDTLILVSNTMTGIRINAGHAQIIIGQIIKEGSPTGTTGIYVAPTATADITILGKNEADTPLNVTDHNHNIISTDQGILLRGKRPLVSVKGYATTGLAEHHFSHANGSPASPATIDATDTLGIDRYFGERQDASVPGQKEYLTIEGTTQVADNEDGRIIITANDVTTTGSTSHNVLDYAAKTGGAVGELDIPLTVAGLPVDKFTLHAGHVQFGTTQQITTPAAQIPYPNVVPLISHGTLISDGGSKHFSIPYALKSTANELKFTLSLSVWVDTDVYVTVAVFESIGSTCIGKRTIEIKGSDATNNLKPHGFTFYYDPVNTTSRTYTARIGPNAAASLSVNGEGAGETPILNYSSFTIEEVPA